MIGRPGPGFDHLWRLTDGRAVIEHARGSEPALEHGYCVDDVSRALVVLCRERLDNSPAVAAADRYLDFVLAAIADDGRSHNRMSTEGLWQDEPGLGDWWGRAIWGLGTAAYCSTATQSFRDRARAALAAATAARSPWLHACAFAVLGAANVVLNGGGDESTVRLLVDCTGRINISDCGSTSGWPWPEPRLRYASAAIPEALLLAGSALSDSNVLQRGLTLMRFLLSGCLRDGHLSVPPSVGRGPGEHSVGENQQPIEVGAIADACTTAYHLTGDPSWRDGVDLCWRWFLGENDFDICMVDWASGGSYDGLSSGGPNLNQGAESTLAMLSTQQRAASLGLT
jgi:hypothetical protein